MIQSPTANIDFTRGLLRFQKTSKTAGVLGRSGLPALNQDVFWQNVFLGHTFKQSQAPVRSLTFGMLPRELDELGQGAKGDNPMLPMPRKEELGKHHAPPNNLNPISKDPSSLGANLLELFSPKFSRLEVGQNARNIMPALLAESQIPIHQLLMLQDANGKTLLDLIFSHQSVEGMEALLDYGLDVEHRYSATGETLLHKASEFGGPDLVGLLLQRGANPNVQSFKGKTPLHLAAAQGNSSTLKRLLKNGALPSIRDYSGLLPSDSGALALYSAVVVDELKNHGAPSSVFTDALELWHRDHIAQNPNSPGVLGLVKIMPQLMAVPGKELMPLFYEVDQYFANFEEHRGYHPNESEWMLFLKHPDFLDRKSDTISFLALALTSITHFIED
ncbi:MAG: ankyrin repeat domain-containing protein, partial [Cyanobacteria bacterium]|nr:ankyrin repeat domain-containing protein [Cyanobacteriota bacterium]